MGSAYQSFENYSRIAKEQDRSKIAVNRREFLNLKEGQWVPREHPHLSESAETIGLILVLS